MTTLKSIALELLQKYEESEASLIWECSGDIEKSEKYLDAEVAKYRELIDKYAEQDSTSQCDVVESTKIKAMQELINESYYKGFIDGKEEGLGETKQEPTTRQSCENCKHDRKECGNDDHYGFCQNWEYAEQSGWEEMTVPCKHCGKDMTFKIQERCRRKDGGG